MESPGKKFTDLVEIESIQDTDLAVIRNDTGVKKTPMQKLSDYIKQKFIGWVFSDLPTTDKTIPGALKELNSALSTLNPITIPLTENVASYYIHAGKMVIGFVNAKSASAVTTIVLNDMPSPQSDGYIIETLNSYNGEKYSLAYETDHWSLRADSRQIAVNEWLRFPIVYLSK